MLKNSLDNSINFHGSRLNGLTSRSRHSRALCPHRGHRSAGRGPRNRNTRVVNAVSGKKQCHLIVQARWANIHAHVRKNLGQGLDGILTVFLRKIGKDDYLRCSRNNRNQFCNGELIDAVQNNDIDLLLLRQNLGNQCRDRQNRGNKLPRQGELRVQRRQRMLVLDGQFKSAQGLWIIGQSLRTYPMQTRNDLRDQRCDLTAIQIAALNQGLLQNGRIKTTQARIGCQHQAQDRGPPR